MNTMICRASLLLIICCSLIFATVSAQDLCNDARSQGKYCLNVPHCEKDVVTIENYYLSDVEEGQYILPKQASNAYVCHNSTGITVMSNYVELKPFSPHKKCNSHVWEKSSVAELFIYPVRDVSDVPQFYYEIDVTPSKAAFMSLIYNNKGTSTMCPNCTPHEITCEGANIFPEHPLYLPQVYPLSDAYVVSQHIPFSLFHGNHLQTNIYSFNMYRYSYPEGPDGQYELQAVNPTFSKSFHEPQRFGVMILE